MKWQIIIRKYCVLISRRYNNFIIDWIVDHGLYSLGAYRPVIIFHGILSNAKNMEDLVDLIQSAEPGTQVYNIDGFDDSDSLKPMWEQVESIRAKMVPIMSNLTDGGHLICFSQGESVSH